MYSKKAKNQNGITIVSLVITIIVLLILAGITINMALGERGIFGTADSASEKQKIAEYLEKIELARMEVASENLGEVTLNNLKAQIVKDGIVSEDAIVTAENYLKITTKEGYIIVVTIDSAQYIEDDSKIVTPPALKTQDIQINVTDADVWTNQEKTITLTSNVEGDFTLQYSTNGKTWKDYTGEFKVYENGNVYVALRNVVGERGNHAQYEIDKIDRVAPIITNVSTTPTTLTFTATDEENGSGIIGYAVTNTQDEPTSFTEVTNTKLLENQSVDVAQNTTYYVWVKDEAGNISAYVEGTSGKQAVTKIEVTPATSALTVGDDVKLSANVQPSNAFDPTYTWSSSDSTVATVDGEGNVTAAKTGTATIYATASDGSGVKGECVVNVQSLTKADITAANYGDIVTYSANGMNDWKIFYKDDNYVYLILSGYLPYSKVPSGAGMSEYSGRPYTAYWPSAPTSMQDTTNYGLFRPSISGVTTSYSLNSSYGNGKAVSALANTTNWASFVNTSYADLAIGAPTLEMWVASWNAKGYTKLYCNNTNRNGYYVGTSSSPSDISQAVSSSPGYSDKLYFPITSGSNANGYNYWLASPSARATDSLGRVYYGGSVSYDYYSASNMSVRPLVRLKYNINMTKSSTTGNWELQ